MRFFEQKKTLKPDDLSVLRSLAALLAEWTGLEPATPCVTGTYSNQLNYHSGCPKESFGQAANIATIFYSTRSFLNKQAYLSVLPLQRHSNAGLFHRKFLIVSINHFFE